MAGLRGSIPGAGLEGAFAGAGYAFPRSTFVDGYYFNMQSASFAYIWRTQPHVPTVVGYLARQFAQVDVGVYEDNDGLLGKQDYWHPAAQSVRWPGESYGGREWRRKMANDYLVYGNAYAVIIKPPGADTAYLLQVPAYAMGVAGTNRLEPTGYVIIYADGKSQKLTPDEVIHWRGDDLIDPRAGWSPMEQLRDILIEESTRRAANIEFNRSGRIQGGIIERGTEAPEWDNEARMRFEEGWSNKAKGLVSGKSRVLEDGMKWVNAGITPREAENLAASVASLATVCNIYGLHPDLFAANPGTTDLKEARAQVFTDVLPAHAAGFAEALTLKLLHGIWDEPKLKFAFDFTAKLEGEEDKFQKLTGAAGRPIFTVNEVRAMIGRDPLPGGDELVIPSNVLEGGKPSTNVNPIPNPVTPAEDGSHREGNPPAAKAIYDRLAKALDEGDTIAAAALLDALNATGGVIEEKPHNRKADPAETPHMDRRVALTKAGRWDDFDEHDGDEFRMKAIVRRNAAARRRAEYAEQYRAVLVNHFERQKTSLAKGSGLRADTKRWNSELAADINAIATKQAADEGGRVSERLLGEFDPGQTVNYLEAGALAAASAINATTQNELMEARGSLKAEDPDVIAAVWDRAVGSRAEVIGQTRSLTVSSFAVHEAAKQNPGQPGTLRVKEWVWSGSDNSRHALLAGEVTPIDSPFSNGMQFPGDPEAPSTECMGCKCGLDVY